jgi:hypothetical protein
MLPNWTFDLHPLFLIVGLDAGELVFGNERLAVPPSLLKFVIEQRVQILLRRSESHRLAATSAQLRGIQLRHNYRTENILNVLALRFKTLTVEDLFGKAIGIRRELHLTGYRCRDEIGGIGQDSLIVAGEVARARRL